MFVMPVSVTQPLFSVHYNWYLNGMGCFRRRVRRLGQDGGVLKRRHSMVMLRGRIVEPYSRYVVQKDCSTNSRV